MVIVVSLLNSHWIAVFDGININCLSLSTFGSYEDTTVTPDQESTSLSGSIKNLLIDSSVTTSTCNSTSQLVLEQSSK